MKQTTSLYSLSLSLVFILWCTHVLQAQEYPISVAIKGGGNLSKMDIDHIQTNPKIGYELGATIDYNLHKRFFLQSGLHFSGKGFKAKEQEIISFDVINISTIQSSTNAVYLQIPLMGGYKWTLHRNTSINILGGVYGAYGLGGRINREIRTQVYINNNGAWIPIDEETVSNPIHIHIEEDTFDHYRRWDAGLSAAIALQYKLFTYTAGYEHGLLKAHQQKGAYNRNLLFTIGYKVF